MINRIAKNRTTERRKKNYTNPCFNIDDIYLFYRSLAKQGTKFDISVQQFKKICHEYNKILSELIVHNSHTIRLPYRLGEISIRKRKMNYKYLKLDYQHFNKTGEKIFHLNSHSDDWKARWYWSKRTCIIPNKSIYSFVPTDSNKKTLARIMLSPNGHKQYFES